MEEDWKQSRLWICSPEPLRGLLGVPNLSEAERGSEEVPLTEGSSRNFSDVTERGGPEPWTTRVNGWTD